MGIFTHIYLPIIQKILKFLCCFMIRFHKQKISTVFQTDSSTLFYTRDFVPGYSRFALYCLPGNKHRGRISRVWKTLFL